MKHYLLAILLLPGFVSTYSQDEKASDEGTSHSLSGIQRNTVYADYRVVFLTAMYERIFPLGNKTGIIAGAGIAQGILETGATNPLVKAAFLLGRHKHFFEAGLVVAPLGNDISVLNPMVGYRYQATKGFFLGFSVVVATDKDTESDTGDESTDVFPIPGISLGYSF